MRAALDAALTEAAKIDKNVFVVVGDVSPIALANFTKEFSDRFINVGVAEANLVGMGAGLAMSGKVPFLFTIATFMVYRCYEQIRDDLCFQNLNVKIIGGGGGFIYSTLGATHHATEDYAVLRALPHMTVVAPADPFEAKKAVTALVQHHGPAYIRLGRSGDTNVYTQDYEFVLGKSVIMREGSDITIIGAGSILKNILCATDELKKKGVEVRVVNMHTIKPLDTNAIMRAVKDTGAILAVEEHQHVGGLGSAIAEVLVENGVMIPFLKLGVKDTFVHEYGSRDHLLEQVGLGVSHIVQAAEYLCARKR
ncbi:MAG: hypothetical protein A2939_00280 [Parcubacteria group bacterium RIFCSPLOWO2_01_FULL_48_18]|nr:MAG: hypothetical protein A2939_00280 [Parcubacteria group bacterium RIFCSPLOWO2_01_FULL_48_18]